MPCETHCPEPDIALQSAAELMLGRYHADDVRQPQFAGVAIRGRADARPMLAPALHHQWISPVAIRGRADARPMRNKHRLRLYQRWLQSAAELMLGRCAPPRKPLLHSNLQAQIRGSRGTGTSNSYFTVSKNGKSLIDKPDLTARTSQHFATAYGSRLQYERLIWIAPAVAAQHAHGLVAVDRQTIDP